MIRITSFLTPPHPPDLSLEHLLSHSGDPNTGAWLGGSDNGHHGTWAWFPTGQLIQVTRIPTILYPLFSKWFDWGPGQPSGRDQHCLYIVGGFLGYQWADFHCEFEVKPFASFLVHQFFVADDLPVWVPGEQRRRLDPSAPPKLQPGAGGQPVATVHHQPPTSSFNSTNLKTNHKTNHGCFNNPSADPVLSVWHPCKAAGREFSGGKWSCETSGGIRESDWSDQSGQVKCDIPEKGPGCSEWVFEAGGWHELVHFSISQECDQDANHSRS